MAAKSVLAGIVLGLAVAGPLGAQDLNPTQAETSAFVRADRDRNGVLTYPEFKIFIGLMAAAGQPTARQVRTFGAYRFAFGVADADRNGAISPWELRNADNAHRAAN